MKKYLIQILFIFLGVLLFSKCQLAQVGENKITKNGNVYLVKGLVDLKGQTFVFDKDAVLQFEGGQIVNGTLVGNDTRINGHPQFGNVLLSGTFQNTDYYASWFSDKSMSKIVPMVMNLSLKTRFILDKDILMEDKKQMVSHVSLLGKSKHTITNCDRFYVTLGNTEIRDLNFRWNKASLDDPRDNYSAVVLYTDILKEKKTVSIKLSNITANGGGYCSFFVRQHGNSSVTTPLLQTQFEVTNCKFSRFTRGVIEIWGGSGKIKKCEFSNIGYELTNNLRSVSVLSLGSDDAPCSRVNNVEISNCTFTNVAAAYSNKNDGRELHGILCKGDNIVISDSEFSRLSTRFTKTVDPGMDAEMIYIKGSNNKIQNNIIIDGAGSISDGVITLKRKTSISNKIFSNKCYLKSNFATFIYLAGRRHEISNNLFISEMGSPAKQSYFFYFKHHDEDEKDESVVLKKNIIKAQQDPNLSVVYANSWHNIEFLENEFNVSCQIVKANGSGCSRVFVDNIFNVVSAKGQSSLDLFSLIGCERTYFQGNKFAIKNSNFKSIFNASNYSLLNNIFQIENTSLTFICKGAEGNIEVLNNTFNFSQNSTIKTPAFIGEKQSNIVGKHIVRGNNVKGFSLVEYIDNIRK
ncbi:MAG: hypothetical protein MJZ99_02775 [Bacteroidales bacterium]|nr:hypothetical protein [Bacteroidales bacterium]